MNPYNLGGRRNSVKDGCGCHEPKKAREVAERIVSRRMQEKKVRAYPGVDAEPILLSAGKGSMCQPFLTLWKDAKRFAACNALADKIGPIDSPEKAYGLIEDYLGAQVNEVFGLITLDLHSRMKSIAETGRGEPAAVMAPMVPTLQVALIDGAHSVILWHCHPSGIEAEPSDADKETTEAFVDAFEQVGDIVLLDHLIAAGDSRNQSFFSFAEAGLLPSYGDHD